MSRDYKEFGAKIHALRDDVREDLKTAPVSHRIHLERMESFLRSAELKTETLMVLNGEDHDEEQSNG